MQKRFTQAAFAAATTLGLVLLSVAGLSAQTPAPAAGTYRGAIEETGAAPTVMVDGEERPLIAAPNATIVRGDQTVQLADLKKGDEVTVTLNPDGSAARVEAIPDDDGGWFKWWYLLPLLLLLLLIPLLRRGKKKDDFVVEPNQVASTTSRRGSDSGHR